MLHVKINQIDIPINKGIHNMDLKILSISFNLVVTMHVFCYFYIFMTLLLVVECFVID